MYFNENKGKHTKNMFDTQPRLDEKKDTPTLREYIQYGIDSGYVEIENINSLTIDQICDVVNLIECLESK